MRLQALTLFTALATIATQGMAGAVTTDGPDLVIRTKGGLEVETADGNYSFEIGGRVQTDYNSYDGVINTEEGESGSDLFFRRARIELAGHAREWAYQASYNLTESGSLDKLFTTYSGWGDLANLSIGQQKEDFGLEDTISSKWITALERSLPANAFDAGDSLGAKLHGANDLITYSLGVYKNGIDRDNSLDMATTGRIVVRPYMEGNNLVHLAAAVTQRDGADADYNSRLGVRGGEDGAGANRVRARVSGLTGDRRDYNLEAAANFGPLHLTAEYFDGEIDVDDVDANIEADGYYLQAGYVLTGESRSYKTASAVFDKVKPTGDGGAWELFARYDALDVNNPLPIAVTAGEAESLTLGVNWYLNPMIKMAVNYVNVETDMPINGEDDGDAIVARLQLVF